MNNKEPISIRVTETIKSNSAISRNDGEIVFEIIKNNFLLDKLVYVDFEGVDIVITAFLNAAFGQLYKEFDEDFIREHISVKGLEINDLSLLKLVIDTAKVYFENKSAFKNTTKNFLS